MEPTIKPERTGPLSARRPRRSIVVLADDVPAGASSVRSLLALLGDLGVETVRLEGTPSAQRIAAVAVEGGADTVDLCVALHGGVVLVRELLRELIRLGRRDVSIVIHRIA